VIIIEATLQVAFFILPQISPKRREMHLSILCFSAICGYFYSKPFVNLRTGNTGLMRYFCVRFSQSREGATWRRCAFARNFLIL
jgi:hypothetical protein